MKCAGNFPLWLAPDQVRVITLNDDEALIAYAQPIVAELRANMVRADADFSATPFKAKDFQRGTIARPHDAGHRRSRLGSGTSQPYRQVQPIRSSGGGAKNFTPLYTTIDTRVRFPWRGGFKPKTFAREQSQFQQ